MPFYGGEMQRLSLLLFHVLCFLPLLFAGAEEKPNVVFIMADDLGYGDLGCFGQEKIKTPHLDRMAAEGMKLTSFYAGATVCAPSRCVLMTGKHTGRCRVRGNAGSEIQRLHDEDVTVAEMFKKAGYVTGMFGKWGLGDLLGSSGHPNKQGFDEFYGYLSQYHAHNYYPTFLIRNGEKVKLRNVPFKENDRGAGWAKERVDYTHDLIVAEGMKWLAANHRKPFFLYLPFTIPHANNEGTGGTGNGQEVPDYGIYAKEDWPDPDKGQAAMITRMDRDIGALMSKLAEYGIAEKTLVIFTSDNGHHKEGGNRPEFFDANGPLRGMKRTLFEGGIRVPTIAWWPGTIKPGTASDHAGYFGDFFATACELAGQPLPDGLQSVSFLPALTGKNQKQHAYLYWEFYEQGSRQAVRFGDWKAIREPMLDGTVALYNLKDDLGEERDLAKEKPELVEKAVAFMDEAHMNDPIWQVRGRKRKK